MQAQQVPEGDRQIDRQSQGHRQTDRPKGQPARAQPATTVASWVARRERQLMFTAGGDPASRVWWKSDTRCHARLYQVLVGLAERLAQAADVHVHGALLDIDVAAPDLIQQLAAGVGAFLVGHEELQQPVLGGAHLGGGAVDGHPVADRIEDQAVDLQRTVALHVAGATQHGFQARHQFARREGLGDVVVGAGFQPLDLVVLVALGREHDDGDGVGQLVALEAAGQFQAGGAGQHPVEQDEIGLAIDDQGVGVLAVVRLQAFIARHFQGHGDHLANGRLIVDDQDGFTRHGALCLSSPCNVPCIR